MYLLIIPIFALIVYLLIKLTSLEKKVKMLEQQVYWGSFSKNKPQQPASTQPKTPANTPELSNSADDSSVFSSAAQSLPIDEPVSETLTPPANAAYWKPESPNPLSPFQEVPKAPKKTFGFIQDNFLTLIGVLTFVLGIGYFVKYAIDQNWITETFRVFIGLAVGFSLMGIAHYYKNKYRVFSSLLVSGGISIFYITLTIAFQEYELLNQQTTFILLTVVTLLAIVMALWYNRQELMFLSIIGGYLAPLMVSTGTSNYVFLFSYILVLNLGSWIVFYKKNWVYLPYLHFLLSSSFVLAWYYYAESTESLLLVLYIALFIQFFAAAWRLSSLYKNQTIGAHLLLLLNQLLFLLVVLKLTNGYEFYVCLAFVLPYLGLVVYYRTTNFPLQAVSYAIVIALLVVAIPFQFISLSVPVLWILMSSILLYLYSKNQYKVFLGSSVVLFIGSALWLSVFWVFDTTIWHIGSTAFFNRLAYGIVLFFITYQTKKLVVPVQNKWETSRPYQNFHLVSTVAVLYLYAVLALELIQLNTYYFTTSVPGLSLLFLLFYMMLFMMLRRWFVLNTQNVMLLVLANFAFMCLYSFDVKLGFSYFMDRLPHFGILVYYLFLLPFAYGIYQILRTHFFKNKEMVVLQSIVLALIVLLLSVEAGNIYVLLRHSEHSIEDYAQLSNQYEVIVLTILWALLAFGLLTFGLRKEMYIGKNAAYALLFLAIAKLYVFDVWTMNHLYRIIAFVVLGLLLLIISFNYQKRIKSTKKD